MVGFDSPSPSREEMDDHASVYLSAMSSSLPESRHPLSAVSSILHRGDPLLSPPLPPQKKNTSSPSSFLEPPSYADVVFSPFEDENRRGNSSEAFSRPDRPRNSAYAKIAVSNPQKEQETANSLVPGSNTYVTYLITTSTSDPASEFSVRRRFRDVVALSDQLAESYRGFFIPPRPDKSVVESQVMQSKEFVEQRRFALEKYLCRLAAHPVIGRSEDLRLFLQAHGNRPLPATMDMTSRILDGAVRLPKRLLGDAGAGYLTLQGVVQPAKGGRNLLRIFKEMKQAVANDWGGVKPQTAGEDKEFLERKVKVQDLEQQLSTASQQMLLSDLSSLHTRAEKLEVVSSKTFGSDRSRICKIEELKEMIRVKEDAKSAALKEYDQIKENNRKELERLDKERHDDFLCMLKGFVINQVGYAEKMANVWVKVADETSRCAKESE